MKTKIISILVIIALAITLYFVYAIVIKTQKTTIQRLENQITLLKNETVPIRFKITNRDSSGISFAIKYYDLDSNEINKVEHILKGDELTFDFYVIKISDRFIAFPWKVYTDQIAPDNGLSLLNDYDDNNFPKIMTKTDMDEYWHSGFSEIFQKIKTGEIEKEKETFGNAVHDLKQFKSFKTDRIYKIIVHTKGGIEILEE